MSPKVACLGLALALAGCGDDDAVDSDAGSRSDSGPPGADSGTDGGAADSGSDLDAGANRDSGVADADICTPVTSDPSAIDQDCTRGGNECPTGYTCQPFVGFVVQTQCQILCDADCECPADHRCAPIMDQSSRWRQCEPG